MSIATMSPGRKIEPDAEPAPVATVETGLTCGRPADRDSLSENFYREIEAWARHASGASGFGDCP